MIPIFDEQIFQRGLKPSTRKLRKHMGGSKNGGTPKWMVYNGKPYKNGWFGGNPIFGNTHIQRVEFFLTQDRCQDAFRNCFTQPRCLQSLACLSQLLCPNKKTGGGLLFKGYMIYVFFSRNKKTHKIGLGICIFVATGVFKHILSASWELTYLHTFAETSILSRWFSFSQGGICEFLEGIFHPCSKAPPQKNWPDETGQGVD